MTLLNFALHFACTMHEVTSSVCARGIPGSDPARTSPEDSASGLGKFPRLPPFRGPDRRCRLRGYRLDDLVIVDAGGKWCYNFMDPEASREGVGGRFTVNIVALLMEISKAVSGGGAKTMGGDHKFREDALQVLITSLLDLPMLADLKVSLPMLRSIVSSAAHSPEQVLDTK